MISVKNVCLKFTKEFYALFDVSFEIKKGESVALLGGEDSGKTSMLRVLCKLEDFNSGEIYIKGIPLKKLDFKNDISMGYFPQTPVFMERKTVKENLEFVLKYKDEKIKKLSLFEKYMIALIRLSFRKLDVLLINNVFDQVENDEREKLIKLFDDMFVKSGVTCLIATTSEEIANRLCSRTIKFNNGQVED